MQTLRSITASMTYYERNLPHWQPDGSPIFITWCLHACFPERRRITESKTASQRFAEIDAKLDRQTSGPLWLADNRIATSVHESLRFAEQDLNLFKLRAWVIMPNHVHLLTIPNADLNRITRAVKNYSARQANATLNRTGQAFWQNESYDHWVRDRNELERSSAT